LNKVPLTLAVAARTIAVTQDGHGVRLDIPLPGEHVRRVEF